MINYQTIGITIQSTRSTLLFTFTIAFFFLLISLQTTGFHCHIFKGMGESEQILMWYFYNIDDKYIFKLI